MITSGRPQSSAAKIEIVDVVNGPTCADLTDFPEEIEGAVAANLHGTPVVCQPGCYKYTNGGWQQFASMKEKRRYPTGVVAKNKFHVFGGWRVEDGGITKTSELISIDGVVEYGPELPTAVILHAITRDIHIECSKQFK